MVPELINPLKERIRFLTEHRNLFQETFGHNLNSTINDKVNESLPDNSFQSSIEQSFTKSTTESKNTTSTNYQEDMITSDPSVNTDHIHSNVNGSDNGDNSESNFPNVYTLPDLPSKVSQIIEKGSLNEFRSHTNARRLLLDTIFNDLIARYSLL